MQIDNLELTNFKNYSHLSIEFQPGVNLFVGSNGSGKTSILEAINVALGGFFASQEQKMQRVIEFDEIKITKGKREPTSTVLAKSHVIEGNWSRTIKRDTKTNDGKFLKSALEYGQNFFKAFDNPEDNTIAPLISYYSCQRLFKDSSSSEKQKFDLEAGRRNGYLQCLKEKAIKPILNDWLGKAFTLNEIKKSKNIPTIDLSLANVELAIEKTLNKLLNIPNIFSLHIYQNPFYDNELFLQYDDEHDLPLSYYSDGFRNILYLVIDLVWRASQLNPWLNLEQITEQVNGVVTIDEIDLHLHPKWQSIAVELIQSLFPKVQFFITTHSPTVVANFQNGTLYLIAENQISEITTKFFGKQINTVLREILGAQDRHKPTQDKIDLLLRMIGNYAPEQEINILLSELTESLGADDIDIQRAIALIDWNKIMVMTYFSVLKNY